MLPGTAIAMVLTGAPLDIFKLLVGIASACLIASANYVLNEWLDADFDRFHPVKKDRPSVVGGLNPALVYTEYALLTAAGFGLGALISLHFVAALASLWLMAILYNVKPFRTKDRVYLDVLSESVNNPIRLALGWFVVTSFPLPPSSLSLGYWMLGAYLMGVKRYAELRSIGAETAALYRRSFQTYTEEKLLISIQFYASSASFFLGVFLIKHRIELLVTLPFIAAAFAWYLHIGMKQESAASTPEHLYRETGFISYLAFVVLLTGIVFVVDIPWLDWFLNNAFRSSR
ncbi:MAG: UbiA family prenyltransferase [Deltaproteobacteria bacterium]|nr:UbiA family prenyltransferase [Deltaproteobacteria bacterium]